MGLDEMGALGPPLLQHEEQAGAQQHDHRRHQGDDRDPVLERQPPDGKAQVDAARGGRRRAGPAGLDRLSCNLDFGGHHVPARGFYAASYRRDLLTLHFADATRGGSGLMAQLRRDIVMHRRAKYG